MKIIAVPSTEAWHKVRASHVGGSEIASLFELSPYSTRFQLWNVKAGNIPPEDLSDNERVQAGNFVEPAIAAWAADKWGVQLRKFHGYAVHETIKGMGCTPDYTDDAVNLVVQIKNVDSLIFHKSPDWEAEGEELLKAPMHILLQVQHELACTGAKVGWLVVLVGGNRLCRMVLEPRPKTIAKLEAEVTAFWQSIADGIEPKPDFAADADTIAALHMQVEADKVIDLSANNRAHEVCAEYMRGEGMEREGKTIKEAAKSELLTLLGDAAKATIGEIVVKATMVKASAGTIITEKMVGMVTGARKAYRRFTITQQQGEQA